jgi:hypothetical protein
MEDTMNSLLPGAMVDALARTSPSPAAEARLIDVFIFVCNAAGVPEAKDVFISCANLEIADEKAAVHSKVADGGDRVALIFDGAVELGWYRNGKEQFGAFPEMHMAARRAMVDAGQLRFEFTEDFEEVKPRLGRPGRMASVKEATSANWKGGVKTGGVLSGKS